MRLSEYARWLSEHPCDEVGGTLYCLNLYALAESVKARNVLEIGTGWGCSTAAFAASLSKRNGTITSVDSHDRVEPKCRALINGTSVTVNFVLSRFEDYAHTSTVDVLYVDTDWTQESIESCRDKYYDLLNPGGLFIVDGVFGQPGPTAFMRDSRLRFMPLSYSDDYAHAVHRKEPWPFKKPITTASCRDCSWSVSDLTEREIVSMATLHNQKYEHTVKANHMAVVAR